MSKEDLPRLAEVLRVPPQFRCPQGTVCSGIEGLCLLLKRLAYFDLIYRFTHPVSELCMIYNVVLDWIYITHGHRLTSWNQLFLIPAWLEQYARAIHQLGCPLANCLGLIANLFGPVEDRRHDAGMLNESGLLNALQTYAHTPTRNPLCIYGDPAYPLRPELMCPYRQGDYAGPLIPQMRAFNAVSSVRISLEWLFGDMSTYFQFIDFKKNLKIGMSAVGKQYIDRALLRNALTCLYGNTTSEYFQLDPPTIESYFA